MDNLPKDPFVITVHRMDHTTQNYSCATLDTAILKRNSLVKADKNIRLARISVIIDQYVTNPNRKT